MNITMEIVSWWNLSRQLEKFIWTALKRPNYWDGVLKVMEELKDENFNTEWSWLTINPRRSPLSVSTVRARKQRSWYYRQSPSRPKILRWTWNLQDNISYIKDSTYCAMKFNAKYALFHQDWSWRMRRSVFEFNPKVKAEIMRAIQKQFDEEVGIWNARKSS